jgi:dTDP-4-amino-4,6-dideoxygalactose transaminase
MIPSVIVPVTSKEILNAVNFLNSNNKIPEFEIKFSEYIGCEHAIATYSGTAALYVLLKAYGLKNGDEVIVPAYTCESVPRLIIDMGYTINFVDVDKGTYNISIEDLKSKISINTKAILAIHMFGNPCEMKAIMEIAADYNAVVIEDAAQSIGAEYDGKKIGTIGDAGFFSLGEGKPLTTINGGFIVTNDERIAKQSRTIIDDFDGFGIRKKFAVVMKLLTYYMLKNPHSYDLIYNMIENRRHERRDKLKLSTDLNHLKFKYTDMQASVGMVQLASLERFNEARKRNAAFLMKHLKEMNGIHLPQIVRHGKPIFLRLPIWVEDITERQRADLIVKLRKSGIDAPVAYPNSLPKFFLRVNGFPNTEELVKRTITLPTHPIVMENDLERMLYPIEDFLSYTKRNARGNNNFLGEGKK